MNELVKQHLELIKKELNHAFTLVHEEAPRARTKLLRSSAMPYCPLRDFYEYGRYGIVPREATMTSAYYTGLGTFIHTLFQNMVPYSIEKISILGRWDEKAINCQEKKCPQKSQYNIHDFNRTGCMKCGKHMPYKEIASFGKYTSHTDQIYRIVGTNYVYIFDIKTCSALALWSGRKNGNNFNAMMNNGYRWQLRSYYNILKPLLEAMGYQILGIGFLFLARDDINNKELVMLDTIDNFTPEYDRRLKERLNKMADSWRYMGRIIRDGNWNIEEAREMYRQKTCESRVDYDNVVKGKYSECPLADVCFNDGKTLGKRLQKAIKKGSKRHVRNK